MFLIKRNKISDVESNKKTDADPGSNPHPCTMYVIFPVNSVIWLIKADNKAGFFSLDKLEKNKPHLRTAAIVFTTRLQSLAFLSASWV